MNRRLIYIACAAGLVTALIAFQIGRSVEGLPPTAQPSAPKTIVSAVPASPEKVNSVFVSDIASVPFADLYDVLRSGKAEDRANWLAQLEALPKGPKKFTAVSSFFKTLVQLDAKEAIELIGRLKERQILQIASDAMFKAAPASVMPQMAEFYLRTNYRETGLR